MTNQTQDAPDTSIAPAQSVAQAAQTALQQPTHTFDPVNGLRPVPPVASAPVPVAQAAPAPVAMMSPDYTSTKMVPSEQVDDAKTAGWEPAIKMYSNQDRSKVKWVPSSQIEDAHKQDWYAVPSPQQKQALEGDAINPSISGNAAIMAAPLLIPRAVGEAVVKPVTDAVVDASGKVLGNAYDYALKAIGNLPKDGATSYLEQHGSGLLGAAARNPELVKIALRYGIPSVSALIMGWKAMDKFVK